MALTTEMIGTSAAVIGTLCWLPQTIKTIRTRKTADISLASNLMIIVASVLWITYGILLWSWPLIGSNGVTLAQVLAIVYVKISVDGFRR